MRKIIIAILLQLLLIAVKSQPVKQPVQLRTELLSDQINNSPVPVNAIHPRFNWQTDSSVKKIIAFRLMVASSAELLEKDTADLWDSKKNNTAHAYVMYAGKKLSTGNYYWKVQVWNEKNIPSPFSTVSSFIVTDGSLNDTIPHYPITFEWQQPVDSARKKNGTYFFDFGKDAFGQLQLKLEADHDDTVMIEAGEMAHNNTIDKNSGRNIRYTKIKLPVTKGLHDYNIIWPPDEKRNSRNPIQMPGYIGEVYPFRYVSIEGISGVAIVKRKMVHYPFDENASSFVSSDTVLNRVWELCKYSVKATSFIGFYVDGDRERIPYEADALINQLSHYAVDAEYSMARRTMAYLLFHPTWPTEWSLQNVLLAWNDYMYTGDDSFLEKYYSELQRKTLMPLADTNGLISTRTGKQTNDFLETLHKKTFDGRYGLEDIIDWPQTGITGKEKENPGETDGFVFTKYNAVVNAFYYRNLVLMEKIAQLLHHEKDAAMYKQKAGQVFLSYQHVFRDPVNGLIKDGDATNHVSIHGNMFALTFGLVPDNDIQKVAAYIISRKMACSVYGAQFLLDALYDAGQDNCAFGLLTATTQRSWYNMIRSGATITLEAWDKVYKPNLDMNHAWGSAPANLIVRKLMGVEPLTPGFEKIRIRPQTGTLSFAKLVTLTLKGKVAVTVTKKNNEQTIDVIIPGASTADIYLAMGTKNSRLFFNDIPFAAKTEKGFFVIHNVSAGKHSFTVR